MADEERPPVEGETIDAPAEEQTGEEQQQPPSIEEIATRAGWKPQDQWKGDGWLPADEFLLKGRESRSDLNREIRSLRDQVDRIGRTSADMAEQVRQRAIAETEAHWQARLDAAVKDDNTQAARQAADKIAEVRAAAKADTASAPDQMPSETTAFVEKNRDWFGTPSGNGFSGGDPLARDRAIEICNRLAKQGVPIDEQLRQAERAVRKEFPELFPAPAKTPAAVQTGTSRNVGSGSKAKGYADMPQESRAMADDYERRLGIKKEDFAKSYWSQQAKAERRVA